MRLTEAQANKLRALSAELEAARLNAQIAALALDAEFRSHGLDPSQHAVVTRDGGLPIGTVVSTATGQPIAEAEHTRRAPRVGEEG